MMMWVLFRVPTVYTHITLLLCVTYDDVGVVSSTHSLHHTTLTTHFVKNVLLWVLETTHTQQHTLLMLLLCVTYEPS